MRDRVQMAAKLADWLGETEELPRRQVGLVVWQCGAQFAYALCMEALRIEAAGGMQRKDGQGRRTPGGVFFALVRQRLGRRRFYILMNESSAAPLFAIPGPRHDRVLRGPSLHDLASTELQRQAV